MPVIESCILHRCNFEFLWQLRYDRWMARTRVIKSLLVGPRCILKHHESSHTNFHKKNEVQQKSRIIKKTLTTHYCSYFISVKKQHDLSQVSRNESLHKIWPIPIPMGRAPPKSTPRNGIQRNLGKFRASWLGGGFQCHWFNQGCRQTWVPHQLGIAHASPVWYNLLETKLEGKLPLQ